MKPVLVSIKSVQRNEEGQELNMEVVSPGSYYRKNRTEYIVYKESELTGLDGVTTIIKVHDDGTIHLVRTGKMQHKQEYKKGKSYYSWYETPMGKLPVTMKTYICNANLNEGIGQIELGYDVTLEGLGSNYNQLTITVQEDNANGNERTTEAGH